MELLHQPTKLPLCPSSNSRLKLSICPLVTLSAVYAFFDRNLSTVSLVCVCLCSVPYLLITTCLIIEQNRLTFSSLYIVDCLSHPSPLSLLAAASPNFQAALSHVFACQVQVNQLSYEKKIRKKLIIFFFFIIIL